MDGSSFHCFAADTLVPSLNQEIIILVGVPGCGKSHFARNMSEKFGYAVVNRDSLKTWQKCVDTTKILLRTGKSVIIDNTNADVESR